MVRESGASRPDPAITVRAEAALRRRGRPHTGADAGDQLSMFDYYHASLMSIMRRSHSEVIGKTRNGRMLVAVHTFMVLDLIAVALGRFYQLITKMI